MQSYRLEVAVRRLYGLSPLIATASSKICVEVHFLDFPPIVIHPQGYAIGDSVTYNICHKADFRMSDEQASTVFPAMCQCQLVGMKEAVAGATKWSCPCVLTPQSNAAAQPPLRMYTDYVISNAAGETVGYADMSCRVLRQDASSTAPAQPPTPAPSFAQAPQASATALPVAAPTAHHAELSRGASADHGKPYIVRVVVGESDRHRRPSQPTCWDGVQDASRRHQTTPTRTSDSDSGHPQRRVRANTAEKNSLLHLLQYDVAYQLQSLSETVAAALHREHDVLARTPLKGADKTDAVSTPRLIKSIDQHVGSIVRVANIILQVANQLVDNSTTPPHIGTSREVKGMARQWRNPVNKLPLPAEGSVGYYLQYEVLYQLQCLGTNLSYMIVAYRSALDTPLSSIPAQHIEYCDELGHEIQHLTKHINILIQSSVDGTLRTAAPSAVPEPAAEGKRQKRGKKNSQSTSPATTAPQLAPPPLTGVTTSWSSTSYSSFSSVRSSSLSSSSLSSSLNRPPARTSPPQAPTVVTLLAAQPPAHPSPQAAAPPRSATSQSLPQPSSYNAPAAKTSSSHTSLSLPTQPPSPYTAAAPVAHPTAMPLSTPGKLQTDLSSSDSIKSLSVPAAPSNVTQLLSPVSWINKENTSQSLAVTAPPVSLSTAPQSTGLHNSASSLEQRPVLATGGPPVLSPPYLSSVPPPLAAPTPLTPPGAAPSPPSLATPRFVTPVPTQQQPQVPLGIPIPVPIPR